MKLGLMQPYFFPYLGYFDLINYVDLWISLDIVQYIRLGWMNRNRVLHQKKGWAYIVAPVSKHPRETLIKNIQIAGKPWQQRILGQLSHYRHAPFYKEVLALLSRCFLYDRSSLSTFNLFSLSEVCDYLGIPFKYQALSTMNLDLGCIERPCDWALQVCKALGAEEYANAPGGIEAGIYAAEDFKKEGITLTVISRPSLEYEAGGRFMPNLSILDILMWNSPEKVKEYLDA